MCMISSLSIIVPAYNEEGNLVRTILAAEAVLQEHVAEALEWIVVDDGSTDDTWSEVTRLALSTPDVIPLRHATNRGLGRAIWTGLAQATAEWCTWMPADGQLEPWSIVGMVRLAAESDLVLLLRHEKDRALWRRFLSLVFCGLMRIMFGFDAHGFSGVYLIRRSLLQGVPIRASTAVQNCAVAIHCQRSGYRVRQVYGIIQPRTSGESKVTNLPTVLRTLLDIIKLRRAV
jgi:dolichol-phosphate mannosyltransferase